MPSSSSSSGNVVVGTRRRRRRVPSSSDKENQSAALVNPTKGESQQQNAKITAVKGYDNNAAFKAYTQASASAPFWKMHSSTFLQCVFECSTVSTKSNVKGLLLLQESESQLLQACRQCVKAVTEETKWSTTLVANLMVATHGLRAISKALDNDNIATTMKLVYHAMVTLSDRLTISLSSSSNETQPQLREQQHNIEIATRIQLSLYELIARLMTNYRVGNVVIRGKKSSSSSSKILFDFPIPAISKSPSTTTDIPLRQVLKIGIQSSLAMCNILLQHRKHPRRNNDEKADEFPSFGTSVSICMRYLLNGDNLLPLLRRTIQNVVTPWNRIMMLSNHEGKKHDVNSIEKEVSTFAKAAHRILWDAASTSTSTTALSLRQHAILALLLVQQQDDSVSLTDMKCIDLAATYAWKAAVTYAQEKKTTSSESLDDFHKSVGTALDRAIRASSSSSAGSLSYVEYCAHRAVHCGAVGVSEKPANQSYIFANLPSFGYVQQSDDQCREEATLAEATLATIYLVTSIQQELTEMEQSGIVANLHHFESEDQLNDVCNTVIQSFQIALQDERELNSNDDIRRCYKLLSSQTLLPQRFSRLSKQLLSSNEKQDGDCTARVSWTGLAVVDVCTQVLADCLIPILEVLIASTSTKDGQQYWDTVVDAQSRIVTLYDTLYQRVVARDEEMALVLADRANQIMDVTMQDVFSCNIDKPSFTIVERFAKLLFSIGKRRHDCSEESDRSSTPVVMPALIYSVAILSRLEFVNDTSSDFVRSSQLMSRYSYVATALLAHGLRDAAILAIISALAYDAVDSTIETPIGEDNSLDSTLSFLIDTTSRRTRVSSSTRKSTMSLIHRLTSILEGSPDGTLFISVGSKSSLVAIADAMITLSTDQEDDRSISSDVEAGNSLGVEALLVSAFSDSLSRCEYHHCGLQQQAKTAALLVLTLGGALLKEKVKVEGSSDEDESFSSLVPEFKTSSRLLFRLLKKIGEEEVSVDFLQGVSHYVASSSLATLLANDKADKEMYKIYWQQLDRAASAFEGVWQTGVKNDRLGLVASLLWIEVMDQREQLPFRGSRDLPLIDAAEPIVKQFIDTSFQNDDPLLSKACACLQLFLSDLQSHHVLNGNYLQAARVANWNLLLSRKWGRGGDSEQWHEARMITSLRHAESSPLISSSSMNYSTDALLQKRANFFGLEYYTAKVRHQASCASPCSLKDSISQLQCLLGTTEEMPKQLDDSASDQLLRIWVTSSILLSLSESYLRAENTNWAIQHAKQCIKACQSGIRLSRQGKYNRTDQTLTFSSFEKMLYERQMECLINLSYVHDLLGDYRKAEAYLISVAEQASWKIGEGSRVDIQSLGKLSRTIKTTQQMICYRLLISLKSRLHPFLQVKSQLWTRVAWSGTPIDLSPGTNFELHLEELRTSVAYLDQHQEHDAVDKELDFVAESVDQLGLTATKEATSGISASDLSVDPTIVGNIVVRAKLSQARGHLHNSCKAASMVQAAAICTEILKESTKLSPALRAIACYYLGLTHLYSARRNGALKLLWKGVNDEEEDLRIARDQFENGLLYVDGMSLPLKRDLCRSLALVLGPAKRSSKAGLSAAALVHSSMGLGAQVKFLKNVRASSSDTIKEIETLFDANGDAAVDLGGKLIPASWRTVAVALCPTGEILVAGLQNGTTECTCISASICNNSADLFDSSAYGDIMIPLDKLIEKSDAQLSGIDEGKATDKFGEESAKRDWWSMRTQLDEELSGLLDDVEERYFDTPEVQNIFGGSCIEPACGNLASKFEAMAESPSDEKRKAGEKLTVVQLKAELKKSSVVFSSKLKKADLVDLFLEQQKLGQSSATPSCEIKKQGNECLIFMLDENLHRFPFEGLPFLQGRAITRMPSLSFLLACIIVKGSSRFQVNPVNARYVVDPESNLGKTAERIVPFVESISTRNDWNWSGVVGEFPTEEFVVESITKTEGLFLYCGHGGGKGSFSKSKIESLVERSDSAVPCKSTVILMGCSSGKLVSINRKNRSSFDRVAMNYEPEGIALSYILSGAPCVVGNLWDVTDRDIDRYCLSFMQQFLAGGHMSLAQCIADARASCKMKNIVGVAPVCYGVPVFLKTE